MKSVKIILILFATVFSMGAKASVDDEGMWLPLLLKDYNYEEMKRLGCRLTPAQIYSINNSSIKDAVVQLGGFCTAEIVSDKGLLLTNHHCAYDAIQSQSTTEHDYLKDGFWAQNYSEELPIDGLFVTFLVRIEDVTERILERRSEHEDIEAQELSLIHI